MSKQHQILSLASDPKNVSRVEPFVERLFKEYQLSPDMYGNILISLTEAVTNAIMHGNKSDSSKLVHVQTKRMQHQMAFLISDEGVGFDYSTLPDPTAPENLLKIGGRGVFLMQQLSDDVIFHDQGRTIEIKFNI
jgi:serine/threonine-protein kinase RsbW